MRHLGSALALVAIGCSPAASPPPPAPPTTVDVPPPPPAPASTAPTSTAPTPAPAAAPPAGELEVKLPKSTDPVVGPQTSALTITKRGELIFEGRILKDMTSLEAEAAKVAASRDDPSVIIMADEAVLYGRVIEAIDALKRGGIAKFAFAVSGPSGGPAAPPPGP